MFTVNSTEQIKQLEQDIQRTNSEISRILNRVMTGVAAVDDITRLFRMRDRMEVLMSRIGQEISL